jgi:hypothetical protein
MVIRNCQDELPDSKAVIQFEGIFALIVFQVHIFDRGLAILPNESVNEGLVRSLEFSFVLGC